MEVFHEFDADCAGNAGGTANVFCQDLDVFCEEHVNLASDAALRRKLQTQRRLEWILALWDDRARFEAVVTSGRYPRLYRLTEALSDCDERAWRRLKNEILAVRAREFLCAEAA